MRSLSLRRAVLSLLLLALPLFIGPAQADNETERDATQLLRKRLGDIASAFILSGCAPTVPSPASLTFAAFACEGNVVDSGKLIPVSQAAAAVGPLNAGNGTYWLALHKDRTSAVGGWTRQAGTHSLWQLATNEPSIPSEGLIFARVTVSGAPSAITAVADYRVPRSYAQRGVFDITDPLYGGKGDGTYGTTAGTVDSPALAAVIAAATARGPINASGSGGGGSIIFFPPRVFNLNTTVLLNAANKPLIFQCSGASESGYGGTVLNWIGGAGIMFDITSDARNITLRDCNIENTGTATIFLRATSSDLIRLENINSRPTVDFSTAHLHIGPDGPTGNRVENMLVEHSTFRAVLADKTIILAEQHHDLTFLRVNVVNGATILGAAGLDNVVNFRVFGGSFNGLANQVVIKILSARSIALYGSHIEMDGVGYAIEIPATATTARSILCDGCYITGANQGNASSHAIRVAFSGAQITISNSFFSSFANPGAIFLHVHSSRLSAHGNDLWSTGMLPATSNFNALGAPTVDAVGNTVGGILIPPILSRALALPSTYSTGATTINLSGITFMRIVNAAPTTITTLSGGVDGQIVTFYFADANTTITRATALLAGGVNFVSVTNAVLTLIWSTTNNSWSEVSRAMTNS